MNTESVVYLARKLGWSREEIGQLTPPQFQEILIELLYQEPVEQYNRSHQVASILAAIANTIPRKRGSKALKASDFLAGKAPDRNPQPETTLEEEAEKKGIKLPKE